MQFDRKELEKLLAMDDESFVTLAKSIADAAGADPAKTQAMLGDPEMLKRRISRINSREAQQLIDAAGKEKSEMILSMLKQRGVDLGQ